MTPNVPHVMWLIVGLLLFVLSIFLSVRSTFFSNRQIVQLKESRKEEIRRLEATHDSEMSRALAIREQIKSEKNEALDEVRALKDLPQLFGPLQMEAFQLAKDLREFRKELGSRPAARPELQDGTREGLERFLTEKHSGEAPFSARLIHGFAERFSRRIESLMHSMGEMGIVVYPLESYTHGIMHEDQVMAVARKIEELAVELDYTKPS